MTNVNARTSINHCVMTLIVLALMVMAMSLVSVPGQKALAQSDRTPTPPGQGPGIGEPAASPGYAGLLQKAEQEGSVRVIIGLRADFEPEGRLSSPQAAEQRRDIASVRAELGADLQQTDFRTVRRFETIPYVALEVSPEALRAAQNSPSVTMIREDLAMQPVLAESGPIVQAPEMWAAGYTGSGQTIAVLDTGVASSHPFLSGKVVDEACYSGGSDCPNGSTSQTGPGSGSPCTYAGRCDHGTHVAGIAAGAGSDFSGVARGAKIVSIQVFSERTGDVCDEAGEDPCARSYSSDQLAGLERVYELRSTHDFSSVNISIGGGRHFSVCDTIFPDYKAAIDNLKSEEIATVVASGNGDASYNGYTDSTTTPACISSAVSVGATDDTDDVAHFSNSASFLDLLAPGVEIDSSVPGGGFAAKNGTSMAAPHVAGAWALLKQQYHSASVDQILSALKSTGTLVKDDRATNGVTKPRINIADASTFLLPLANDKFVNARGLLSSRTVSVKGKNVGATREIDEPDHIPGSSQLGDHSLWYKWTAPITGRARLHTCTSSFDTALAVYTGNSLTTLSRKASDDNSCLDRPPLNGSGSELTFNVIGGTSYKIAVSGHSVFEQGNFTLNLNYAPPANDNFADAQVMSGGTHFSKPGDNLAATREPDEPDHMPNYPLPGDHSVWYDWTAPETGEVTIHTCSSTFDTILNVYTGDTLNTLSPAAFDDDSCPSGLPFNDTAGKVTFNVTEGTSYKISVSSFYAEEEGNFDLRMYYTPPANDAFANAQEIGDASVAGTNIGATRQSGEPDHLPGNPLASGEHSVWYRWTALSSGPVTLDTCASDFGSSLAVYTGSSLNALSPTPASPDSCEGSSGRKLTFDAVAGTTYQIAVLSGFASGPGTFTLELGQDVTAPSVKSVKPAGSATGVGRAANVRAVFSEAMQANTINVDTFTLRRKGTSAKVSATVTYDSATGKAILNPDTTLERGAVYIATVAPETMDVAGNQLDQKPARAGNQAKVWRFEVKP